MYFEVSFIMYVKDAKYKHFDLALWNAKRTGIGQSDVTFAW